MSSCALSAGSLIALFVSESEKLFGFSETGHGTAIVLAIIAEAVAVVLLTPVALVSLKRVASGRSASGRIVRRLRQIIAVAAPVARAVIGHQQPRTPLAAVRQQLMEPALIEDGSPERRAARHRARNAPT